MKKNLPLYVLLVFLMVVNGFFLYNYLGREGKQQQQRERKPPGSFLVKELGFDEAQKKQFRALTRVHRRNVRGISEEIRVLKDVLFDGLSDVSLASRNTDSIATLIGEKQKQRELLTFNHFAEVQKLCNAQQKEKFSKIIKDALRRGTRVQEHPRKGKPHPDGKQGNRPLPLHDR
jgi:hypothetical protein